MLDKVMQPEVAYSRQDLSRIYPEYRKELGDLLLKGRVVTDVRFLSVDSSHFVHTFILKEQTVMDKQKELQEKIKQTKEALEELRNELETLENQNSGIFVRNGVVRFVACDVDTVLSLPSVSQEIYKCPLAKGEIAMPLNGIRLTNQNQNKVRKFIIELAENQEKGLTK